MSAPGWYPDPGGERGMFRYWDGRSWSPVLSPAPPPPANRPTRRRYGWLLGALALLVAVVVAIALVVRQVGVEVGDGSGGAGRPTSDVCPREESASPAAQPNDGRVHGGKLSYPMLGPPWSAPRPEYGVAFGRGVLIQSVEIERSASQAWLAAVLIGELVAGDGFFAPRDGAAIVVRCVSGTFYGNSEVTRDDTRNEALNVDGHDAWVIESQLRFDVPGIQAKRELLIVVVVDTGDGSGGLFYASIPENAPHLVKPARDALAGLSVDG